jgi:hypothetical protein
MCLTGVGDPGHFGADPDPRLRTDPDPTPDLTPFVSDFKDAKKLFFQIFSYNLPAGTLSSVLKVKFFANFVLQ